MNPTARHAPATARNREPILAVLRNILPPSGLILEIASGTGEHVRFFAENLPHLDWQPGDPDPDALASIAAWSEGVPNIRPPLQLDASALDWPIARADASLCINMVHISPWAATEGLFAGAARLLPPGAPLYLYGPYRRDGVPTEPSNEAFDQSLKARNPEWGLRRVEDVIALATRTGLGFERLVEMPANNLSVIFRRL
jgi:SAM-dependent methyltransferase